MIREIAGWEDRLFDPQLVYNIITKIMSRRPDSTKYHSYSKPTNPGKEIRLQALSEWWRKLKLDPVRFAAYRQKHRDNAQRKTKLLKLV